MNAKMKRPTCPQNRRNTQKRAGELPEIPDPALDFGFWFASNLLITRKIAMSIGWVKRPN